MHALNCKLYDGFQNPTLLNFSAGCTACNLLTVVREATCRFAQMPQRHYYILHNDTANSYRFFVLDNVADLDHVYIQSISLPPNLMTKNIFHDDGKVNLQKKTQFYG